MSKIWFDKWVHIGLFLALIFLFSWAGTYEAFKQIFALVIAALLYGIVIEICQEQFISNRDFDWSDWLADMIGSIVGAWCWSAFSTKYIKK